MNINSYLFFALLVFSFFGFTQNTSVITTLPSGLEETSGLLKLNNRYYTFNDSGNASELYEFDNNNGSIIRTIVISNATNTDWEAIAADNTHIYLGDIGNNNGTRTNLRIYKFSIGDLENSNSLTATTLAYDYNDQTDFTSSPFNTDFDAEALIATTNNLFIFTKNWVNGQCNIYKLNKTSSTQTATNIGSLNTNGLVTDAHYDSTDNEVTFSGYNVINAFIWRLSNFTGTDFTSGQLTKFTLTIPTANSIQVEGISEASKDVFYLSSELLNTRLPTLFSVDFNTLSTTPTNLDGLKIYPNPTKDYIYVSDEVNYEVFSFLGTKILSGKEQQINLSNLSEGIYFLNVSQEHQSASFKIIKN